MDATNYLQALAEPPQPSAPMDAPRPPIVATASASGAIANSQSVGSETLLKLIDCLQKMDQRMDKLESMVIGQSSPAGAIAPIAPTSRAIRAQDDYETPVPTIHQRRPVEGRQDAIAWFSMLGIVGAMAGLAAVAFTSSPTAQAEKTSQSLSTQIESKDRVIESLADKASKSQCKALCF